jgi:sugar lactone lactonase YvrE
VLFSGPAGVAVDTLGYVYVSDNLGGVLRVVSSAGVVSTLAGLYQHYDFIDGSGTNARFYDPGGIAVSSDGTIYVADNSNGAVRKLTPSGIVTTLIQTSFNPVAVALSSGGALYVSSAPPYCISIISTSGTTTRTLFAGQGGAGYVDGLGTNAYFGFPYGIAFNSAGLLFIADRENHCIRVVDTSGK